MNTFSKYEKIIVSKYPTATVEYCKEYGVPDGLVEHLEAKWFINCALSGEDITSIPKSNREPFYSVEQYVLRWVVSDEGKYDYYVDTVKPYFDLEKLGEIESRLGWEYNSLASWELDDVNDLIAKIGFKKIVLALIKHCENKKLKAFKQLLSSIIN